MGVTIRNCKYSIDMGYFGFCRLRNKVAMLLDQEFGVEYVIFLKNSSQVQADKLNEIIERKNLNEYVLDFLFQSDCDGKVSAKACRALYTVIKDYDDDVIYGYPGWKNPAMFDDFKKIVENCCKNRRQLSWY